MESGVKGFYGACKIIQGENNMRIEGFIALMVVAVSLSGCAGNREAVVKATVQTRLDVFQVVQTTRIEPGKALLRIEFPVKTYKSRIGTKYIKHTDPPFTAVVNIDGQTVELTDEPVLEELPGDFMKNPEAGTGWKYVFRKTVLLEPGRHQIAIAVPQADVVVGKELVLNAGENLLQLAPLYNSCISRYPNYPRFSHGFRGMTVRLNAASL
jgi:hypothetical protein